MPGGRFRGMNDESAAPLAENVASAVALRAPVTTDPGIAADAPAPEPDPRPTPEAMAAHLDAGGDAFDLVERPAWFSFTAFDTFERCPRQYALRYLCQPPEERPVWPAAEFGGAAHAAFETFTRERRERAERGEPEPSREELGCWFDEAFERTSLPADPWADGWRGRAARMLDRFWHGEHSPWLEAGLEDAPQATTVGEELHFRLPLRLEDETEVRVSGFIDRVDRRPDGSVEILDYKTGNGVDRRPNPLQLGIYALGCRDALGFGRPSRVGLYFVEHGLRTASEQSDVELDLLALDLAGRAARIRSSRFEPVAGPDPCRWCDFAAVCRPAPEEEVFQELTN
jgi:hypothetical protein